MPKIPRDCGADDLVSALRDFEYRLVRQTGSHIRLYSPTYGHAITVPNHKPIKIGTLSAILSDVAGAVGISKASLIEKL